jgi:hypothetical protein
LALVGQSTTHTTGTRSMPTHTHTQLSVRYVQYYVPEMAGAGLGRNSGPVPANGAFGGVFVFLFRLLASGCVPGSCQAEALGRALSVLGPDWSGSCVVRNNAFQSSNPYSSAALLRGISLDSRVAGYSGRLELSLSPSNCMEKQAPARTLYNLTTIWEPVNHKQAITNGKVAKSVEDRGCAPLVVDTFGSCQPGCTQHTNIALGSLYSGNADRTYDNSNYQKPKWNGRHVRLFQLLCLPVPDFARCRCVGTICWELS